MATENTNVSTKYKDIILKSVLIHSGSPAVYQLKPKEETIETLTRKTVGEKDINKTNKTILLVGETGTGKSALINALLNYMMGVKFEDDVWFDIVEQEEEKSRWESQTTDVIVYQIFGFEANPLPYSLTIIDTPGYGDTRGIEHDVITRQRLFDLFRSKDGIDRINAVAVVMKASDNRLSDRLTYVINSVTSLFGKDLEKNIVALLTHSDGRKPKNTLQALQAAKIKCAMNEKNEPLHYLFNNSQHEDRTEDRDLLEQANNISVKGLSQFKDFLEKTAPEKLGKTVEVLNERIRLAACVHNLQDRVRETELKQREVKQIQEALKKHEEVMKKNENFTIEVDEVYKDKEAIVMKHWLIFPIRATCCTVCEENCHYPGCTLAPTPKRCEVMKEGRCTVCKNKCPASKHVKENWKYVTKTKKVQKTLHDIKGKYKQNQTEHERKLNLEEEMNKLTTEKRSLLEESYQHVVRLEQIALNVDSLSTHVHLDVLIEKMKETGDTEKVQKLEEMRRRQDEGTRAALRYARQKSSDVAEHPPSKL